MIPVNVHGMATDENEKRFVIILTGKETSSNKWLPIQISPLEAQNIAIQMNNLNPGRPLAHDLLAEITKKLNGSVEEIRLTREDGRTLGGTVVVSRPKSNEGVRESFELEASPSDAIALALRTDSEIVVEEQIMQTQDPTDPNRLRNTHPSDEVTRLQKQLDEAVENEEFEKASEMKHRIRDAIRVHEESVENLEGDIEEQLRKAYEGSDGPSENNASEEDS